MRFGSIKQCVPIKGQSGGYIAAINTPPIILGSLSYHSHSRNHDGIKEMLGYVKEAKKTAKLQISCLGHFKQQIKQGVSLALNGRPAESKYVSSWTNHAPTYALQ